MDRLGSPEMTQARLGHVLGYQVMTCRRDRRSGTRQGAPGPACMSFFVGAALQQHGKMMGAVTADRNGGR